MHQICSLHHAHQPHVMYDAETAAAIYSLNMYTR